MTSITQRNQPVCSACGSLDSKLAFIKADYSHYSCTSCNTLYVYPRPQQADLNKYYQAQGGHLLSQLGWNDTAASHRHVFHQWKYLLKKSRELSGTGPLLDIGCGTGQFLLFAKEEGWDNLTGVDIAADPAKAAHNLSGANIYTQNIFAINLTPNSYSCVVIMDLIEHVSDVHAILKESYRLLRPNGVIVIGTINRNGLSIRTFGMRSFSVYPPEHLTFFTRKGLCLALQSAGFKVIEQRTASIYLSEWMRFIPGATEDRTSRQARYKEMRSNITKTNTILGIIRFFDLLLRMTGLGDEHYALAQKLS